MYNVNVHTKSKDFSNCNYSLCIRFNSKCSQDLAICVEISVFSCYSKQNLSSFLKWKVMNFAKPHPHNRNFLSWFPTLKCKFFLFCFNIDKLGWESFVLVSIMIIFTMRKCEFWQKLSFIEMNSTLNFRRDILRKRCLLWLFFI